MRVLCVYRLLNLYTVFLMIKALFLLLGFGLSCFTNAQDLAKHANGEEALSQLVASLNRISTLSATFVQYATDQRGARIQQSKGELKADRAGKFYWHTFEPLEQIVISDGKEVTVFDPDLEQATVQAVNEKVQSTPAILFSGDTSKIGDLFTVELRHIGAHLRQFTLMPKTADSLFERLKLRFSGKNVSELRITDALGQESTMSFVQTQINLDLPDSAFTLTLPEGTDIIRDIQMPGN